MNRNAFRSNLGVIIAAGSVWGLTEFAFGLGLQKCATLFTGAVLTGLALFWLSLVWSITRSFVPVFIIVGITALFKWLDALLLQVAWNHGSIVNPIFAFITIMVGFLLLMILFRKNFPVKMSSRIMAGAGAAIVACALFPLAGFATGTPACLYAGTNIPLVIVTSPVAILLSMITVPLGFGAGSWYTEKMQGTEAVRPAGTMARIWSPAIVVCCILIMTLARII